MSVPYDRIRSRVNLDGIPCAMCHAVTVLPVIDHCHVHGATRGVLCVSCNNRMARVDANLAIATPRDMFHRDNCPGCRAEGFEGVARQLARHATRSVAPRRVAGATPGQRGTSGAGPRTRNGPAPRTEKEIDDLVSRARVVLAGRTPTAALIRVELRVGSAVARTVRDRLTQVGAV